MVGRLPLHVLAPGLAIAAAVLGGLRALVELWGIVGDGGSGFAPSAFTLWLPLLYGLFSLAVAAALAVTGVLALLRASPVGQVSAAVVAGLAAGFFAPGALQPLVVLFVDPGVGSFFSLLYGVLVSVVVVAAAVAAAARLLGLVRGDGTSGPGQGAPGAEPAAWGTPPAGGGAGPAWGPPAG